MGQEKGRKREVGVGGVEGKSDSCEVSTTQEWKVARSLTTYSGDAHCAWALWQKQLISPLNHAQCLAPWTFYIGDLIQNTNLESFPDMNVKFKNSIRKKQKQKIKLDHFMTLTPESYIPNKQVRIKSFLWNPFCLIISSDPLSCTQNWWSYSTCVTLLQEWGSFW